MRHRLPEILLTVFLAAICTAGVLSAGSYSFTTTAGEDTVIARMRAFANQNNLFGATPAAQYATDTDFVNAMCRLKVLEVRDQARAQSDAFENAWATLTPAQKDNICSLPKISGGLGLSANCKP